MVRGIYVWHHDICEEWAVVNFLTEAIAYCLARIFERGRNSQRLASCSKQLSWSEYSVLLWIRAHDLKAFTPGHHLISGTAGALALPSP